MINNRFLSSYVFVLCHFVYLIFGVPSISLAQESDNLSVIEKALTEEGFENVSVFTNKDTIRISFENRRYRFEPRGLARVIQIANQYKTENEKALRIFLLSDKVPLLEISLLFISYQLYFDGIIDAETFNSLVYASSDVSDFNDNWETKNSSLFKVDIPVIPTWAVKFGNFSNPIESNINLIPELNSTLSKGLTLKAQLIIPIQNDFFFVSERQTIRPGNITLNQFAKLDDDFYFNVTAGTFDKNRAGLNLEIKKQFKEGRIGIGANIGFTGYYSFTGIETEYYDQQKYLTAIFTTEYRYLPYDLTARLEVGNFLFNVFSTRFEVMRQFGEVKIGFFAVATKDDIDGGFRFSIPIPPEKYTKLKWLRLRPSDNFIWQYRAKGFPQNGVTCNTGYSLTDKLMDYNPNFIKKRLIIEINKKRKK